MLAYRSRKRPSISFHDEHCRIATHFSWGELSEVCDTANNNRYRGAQPSLINGFPTNSHQSSSSSFKRARHQSRIILGIRTRKAVENAFRASASHSQGSAATRVDSS